jgi:hypothetical protein
MSIYALNYFRHSKPNLHLHQIMFNERHLYRGKQAHIIQSHTSEDQSFHSLNVRLGVC